jgi:cysteinyl-tRNA synthetase
VEAARALERLWGPVRDARKDVDSQTFGAAEGVPADLGHFRQEFIDAMDDDFNTPQALGALFEMTRALNRAEGRKVEDTVRGAKALAEMLGVLGFREPKPAVVEIPREVSDRVAGLVRARAEARAKRDWKRADELRAELARLDVTVKDTPQGTDWEWKGVRATERL